MWLHAQLVEIICTILLIISIPNLLDIFFLTFSNLLLRYYLNLILKLLASFLLLLLILIIFSKML
ncbi:hypothetical protein GLOIN_2v1511644, partial [Rhizophagus irregularis DAOM 181602=DAOM 197198]